MKKSVAGMIGKILGLRLYKRDSCTCCSSLPLERFFHEENYFCPILVQPLQEEEQRPLKTRNRSAQNVRSQLPKTVSLFENKGKLQPGNGHEASNDEPLIK